MQRAAVRGLDRFRQRRRRQLSRARQAAIGTKVIIPVTTDSTQKLACFDASTQTDCSGAWPVALGFSYVSSAGAPFPLLDPAGAITGFCLPTGTDPVLHAGRRRGATPTNLASVVTVPRRGTARRSCSARGSTSRTVTPTRSTASTTAPAPAAPTSQRRSAAASAYLYTVNPDPQRPTCIWVNSDNGTAQIQNFDAYTSGPCGQGDVRVLGSQFVVNQAACTPNTYAVAAGALTGSDDVHERDGDVQ